MLNLLRLIFKNRWKYEILKSSNNTFLANKKLIISSFKKIKKNYDSEIKIIENIAQETHRLGAFKLWENYNKKKLTSQFRKPNDVRLTRNAGIFYICICELISAKSVIEIGSGFGVSGMYFLTTLKKINGKLYSFEANTTWANIAKHNFSKIGGQFFVKGEFNLYNLNCLPKKIDLALIDGIHDPTIVKNQIKEIYPHLKKSGILFLDDINFSLRMQDFWNNLRNSKKFSAISVFESRLGILQKAHD